MDQCQFDLPRCCILDRGHDGPHITRPDKRITALERDLDISATTNARMSEIIAELERQLADARSRIRQDNCDIAYAKKVQDWWCEKHQDDDMPDKMPCPSCLVEDRERMDWLDENANPSIHCPCDDGTFDLKWAHATNHRIPTLREAIDAAREKAE